MARAEGSYRYGPVKRGVAASVAALGIAGFIGACDSGSPAPRPSPTASHSQFHPNGTSELNFYLERKGPCAPVPPFLATKEKVAKADAACFASEKGPIAVVNFGQPEGEIQKIVQGMTTYLRIGSDGLVRPEFTIVNATSEAVKDLQNIPETLKGCVDVRTNPQYSASFIAGYTMQNQLRNAGYVLAISDEKPCGWEAGQADPIGDRYADMYPVKEPSKKALIPIVAVGGAHEIFHLLLEGHVGDFNGKDKAPFLIHYGQTFDLAKYLKHGKYDEYASDYSDNIMGSFDPLQYVQTASGKIKLKLVDPVSNPIQIDTLLKPEVPVKGDGILNGEQLHSSELILTRQDAQEGKYAMTHLEKPVKLTDHKIGSSYEFDTLAIVPDPYSPTRIDSALVYLVSFEDQGAPQTTIVNLGSLAPTNEPLHLKYHNQTISVKNIGNVLALQSTTR